VEDLLRYIAEMLLITSAMERSTNSRVPRLTGIKDITPHCLEESIPAAKWGQATEYVERYRPPFARKLCEEESRDLAVSWLFLPIR
jgi:hypothetical protein